MLRWHKLSNIPCEEDSGFILLPVLMVLLCLFLMLSVLTERFYTHIAFTHAAINYFEREKVLAEVLPIIEKKVSLEQAQIAQPKDQSVRLENYRLWPKINMGLASVSYQIQLIHGMNSSTLPILVYSTLISIGTKEVPQLDLYELVSLCSLADSRCRPLQLSKINP